MDKSKNPEPPKYSRRDYLRAEPMLMELHKHRKILTRQQSQTIKGQALSGDIDGARRGMEALLARARKEGQHGKAEKPRDFRLAACSNNCRDGCKPCPYFPAHDTDCLDKLHADAVKLIEQLSAEGLWVYCPDDEGRPRWKCSRCGKYVHKDPAEKRYCALCGQRNRKEA